MILNTNFSSFIRRVNFIFRTIVLNSISLCKSGHLGLPLGNSDTGSKLFWHTLNFYSKKSNWLNRDKFVLSAGHGSIFLYTFLFLTGYKYTLKDLFMFRKLNSKTPGHPEFNLSLGIESTTGPLGQGISNSVGIGVSDMFLTKTFTSSKKKIINGCVVCFAGDGCLQEGITQESISLAGNWKLKNLLIIYDSNKVTLDCLLNKTQNESVHKRFRALGFEVKHSADLGFKNFLESFLVLRYSGSGKPKLLVSETVIGLGIDDVAGFPKAHGEAGIAFIHKHNNLLVKLSKNPNLLKYKFLLNTRGMGLRKLFMYKKWLNSYYTVLNKGRFDFSKKNLKKLKTTFNFISTPLNTGLLGISTRQCGSLALNKLASSDDFILSGSADLFSSCKNLIGRYRSKPSGNISKNIYFGVREHAMGAIANGIAYQGYYKIFISTFLTFSDYLRPAIRLSALSKLPVKFIFTHDSIAVGKDGPTHQPVETLSTLRMIPNLNVLRPFNYWETLGAYLSSYNQIKTPSVLVLSRQGIKFNKTKSPINHISGCLSGSYTLLKEVKKPKVFILSTGSDIELASKINMFFKGFSRLVSVPNFNSLSIKKINSELNLNKGVRVIVIESGSTKLWYQLNVNSGAPLIIGLDSFGKSGSTYELLDVFKLRFKYILNSFKNTYTDCRNNLTVE